MKRADERSCLTIDIVDMVTDLPSPNEAMSTLVSALSMVILLVEDDKDGAVKLVKELSKNLLRVVVKHHDHADMVRHCIELIKRTPDDLGQPH